jgi:hypothetical protein
MQKPSGLDRQTDDPLESFFRETKGIYAPKQPEKCPLFSVFYSEFDM